MLRLSALDDQRKRKTRRKKTSPTGEGTGCASDAMILARSSGKQNWTRVSKSHPCPICGKPDNCSISIDGNAVWCGRIESPKQNSGGQWFHKLSDENRPASFVHPSHKRKEKPKRTDWPEVSQALASCDPGRIDQLATRLIVPQWALSELGCGWGSIDDW